MACFLFFYCKQENPEKPIEFCSYLDDGIVDLTIPFIDNFLDGLPSDLNEEQKLLKLTTWLESCPCVSNANILYYEWCSITSDTRISQIFIRFDENGIKKDRLLYVLMSNPLKATGFQKPDNYQELELTGSQRPEIPCKCEDYWLQDESSCERKLVWDYPVKPGTDEWEEYRFGRRDELLEALQIPEDILSSLSIEELTAICVQYPTFWYYTTANDYDNRKSAIDQWLIDFNGIKELFNRDKEEVSKEFLKHYRCTMKQLSDETVSDNQKVFMWVNLFCPLEIILSHYFSQDEADYLKILQHLVCGAEIAASTGLVTSPGADNYCARANIIDKIDKQYLETISSSEKFSLITHGSASDCAARLVNDITCQLIQSNKSKK